MLELFLALLVGVTPHDSGARVLAPHAPAHIGGCRAYQPRASFERTGCTAQTACEVCGEGNCVPARLPSGMNLPRHNVPQYMGNAVWDGHVLDLPGAVRAMLGDPLSFAVSPELDAIRTLLMLPNSSAHSRASRLDKAWPNDYRYNAFFSAQPTRESFFASLVRGGASGQGLTPTHVLSSFTWRRLPPTPAKTALHAALSRGVALSHEVATCAAIFLADAIWAHKESTALSEGLLDEATFRVRTEEGREHAAAGSHAAADSHTADDGAHPAGTPSLWDELHDGMVGASTADSTQDGYDFDDAEHNQLFTTPYSWVAAPTAHTVPAH